MKTMEAREFKARCLRKLDRVSATREPVLITKKGRPVAKLVPVGLVANDSLSSLVGIIDIVGDIESPVGPPEAWNVLR